MNKKIKEKFKLFINIFNKVLIILLNLILIIPVTIIACDSLFELHFNKSKNTILNHNIFTINKNEPLNNIAKNLKNSKIIHSDKLFMKWIIRLKKDRNILYGKYLFNKSYSLFQVIQKLSKTSLFLDTIRIQEGSNIQQISILLEQFGYDKKLFLELCNDKKFIKKLNIDSNSLEGFLFPDTYKISFQEKEKNIIKIMTNRFFRVIKELNIEDSNIYKTYGLYKGLIIASIIEKESKYIPERTHISSVFWNRVKQNWRIDSDVTIRFALNKWKKPLTAKDLRIKSKYNTRKYKGFPPTPICNPSKSSIYAAFNPIESDSMFFIAKGNKKGDSFFAKSLRNHNKFKRKLKKEGKLH